jgi:hypothetical protein
MKFFNHRMMEFIKQWGDKLGLKIIEFIKIIME